MPVVKLEPSDEYPVPYSTDDEELDNFADKLASAANTAELLESLGAQVEVDDETLDEEKQLLEAVVQKHKTAPLRNLPTASAAASFLRAYGQNLAFDANQVRMALTNKLLEIADCGEIKYELKALELLGKHSDIGLFTNKSEITVNYKDPEGLENAIKERVKRLLNAEVIDMKPLGMDLDEELGLTVDAEFTEVEEPQEETQDEEGQEDE